MKTYNFTRSVRWIISYITFLIIFFSCASYYLYEPPIETVEESIVPVFAYPLTDPEFLQAGNIFVSYEYVANGKHLVAVSNNGHEYIMPLFDDRDEALNFMNLYFAYLRELEK